MADRNLITVIDAILSVAPDLSGYFESLKDSIKYTAPELMPDRWWQAAGILNEQAADHPKANEIAAIFQGPPPEEPKDFGVM